MTRTVPRIDEAPAYSSNDSHIHFSVEAKARRERLGLTLKPGETDEVEAPGPQHLCKVCSPNGEIGLPEAPGNRTYDNSVEIAEENEKEAQRLRIDALEEQLRSLQKKNAPAPTVAKG